MIGKAYIIPTGDEIKDGTVIDLDCPEVMKTIVRIAPDARVTRVSPVIDEEGKILAEMEGCLSEGADLIVMVGGSGGGHRYSETLGKDFTHSGMEKWLDEKTATPIFGKNGHMWSKLVCGRKDGCLVINVPGPVKEARAAIEAFAEAGAGAVSVRDIDIHLVNKAMAKAVLEQYPKSEVNGTEAGR